MNTSEYLLLFRSTQWHKGLSPEEIQRVMNRWNNWFKRLAAEGKLEGGHPLEREGRVISKRNAAPIADGPFKESKEAIGGYFLLKVSGVEEAVEIAKMCPALDYGLTVEVRPVAPSCPVDELVAEQLAESTTLNG
jgi:hypothetical protein